MLFQTAYPSVNDASICPCACLARDALSPQSLCRQLHRLCTAHNSRFQGLPCMFQAPFIYVFTITVSQQMEVKCLGEGA